MSDMSSSHQRNATRDPFKNLHPLNVNHFFEEQKRGKEEEKEKEKENQEKTRKKSKKEKRKKKSFSGWIAKGVKFEEELNLHLFCEREISYH